MTTASHLELQADFAPSIPVYGVVPYFASIIDTDIHHQSLMSMASLDDYKAKTFNLPASLSAASLKSKYYIALEIIDRIAQSHLPLWLVVDTTYSPMDFPSMIELSHDVPQFDHHVLENLWSVCNTFKRQIVLMRMQIPYLRMEMSCEECWSQASSISTGRTQHVKRFELITDSLSRSRVEIVHQLWSMLDNIISITFVAYRPWYGLPLIHHFETWADRTGHRWKEVRWFCAWLDILHVLRGNQTIERITLLLSGREFMPETYTKMIQQGGKQSTALHTLRCFARASDNNYPVHILRVMAGDNHPALKAVFLSGPGRYSGISDFLRSVPHLESLSFGDDIEGVTDIVTIPSLTRLSLPVEVASDIRIELLPRTTELILDFGRNSESFVAGDIPRLCDKLFWAAMNLGTMDESFPALQFVVLKGWPTEIAMNSRWSEASVEAFVSLDVTCQLMGASIVDGGGQEIDVALLQSRVKGIAEK